MNTLGLDGATLEGHVERLKKQVLSTEVTPEQPRLGPQEGVWVKAYSVCANDCPELGKEVKVSAQGRENGQLWQSHVGPSESNPRGAGMRASVGGLSQSVHHSPNRPVPLDAGQKGAAGNKKGSVKEEISKFSYKRLVGHLERKYQDIRNIFRTESGPRAQARLASPSPSPPRPK